MTDSAVGAWVSTLPFSVPFNVEALVSNPRLRASAIQEGDQLVGMLSPDEEVAAGLLSQFAEAAERASLDSQFAQSDEARDAADVLFEEYSTKRDAMRGILSAMIRENHGLWSKPTFALRHGGKIVVPVTTVDPDIMTEIRRRLAGYGLIPVGGDD